MVSDSNKLFLSGLLHFCWFVVSWHINLLELFNAKSILLEEQYLVYSHTKQAET